MEQNTAHRAADTLTELLKAHVSNERADIDVHEAMAIRDDVRELAYELEGEDPYELPEVGETLYDRNSNPRYGSGEVEVVETIDTPAKYYYVETDSGKKSVAYMNPGEPEDVPVVRGRYVDGSDKVYTFPVTRLE